MAERKTTDEHSGSSHCSVVSFGGGVNSTALLVGLEEREERPNYIVFADTGGERPGTYAHIKKSKDGSRRKDFRRFRSSSNL